MNSHEGGLREGVGQPGYEWVVPDNSDKVRFKRCYIAPGPFPRFGKGQAWVAPVREPIQKF